MDDPTSAPELDALLCFDLYAAQRAVTAAYRPILGELGLTYPQYLVLVVLWSRERCSIGDLAGTLRLDHATLTPLLRRMEAAGLVAREPDPGDARRVLLRVAPGGAALRARATEVQCRIAEALGIDDEQAAALRDLLRVVTAGPAGGTPTGATTGGRGGA